jgi:hypothetical protein
VTFSIEPFVGALPIRFDMTSAQVREILGQPKRSRPLRSGVGTSEEFESVNIRFDVDGRITDLSIFGQLSFLKVVGRDIWSEAARLDPNRVLLAIEPEPTNVLGFWVYRKLGIAVTGYQDDDRGNEAVGVLSQSGLQRFLAIHPALPADTSHYAGRVIFSDCR